MQPYKYIFNLPNILTFVRISVIPILVVVYYLPVDWGHLLAAIIFACASAMDWLDGYLARSLQQTTKLGAFLDPVADKLLVCVALIIIVAEPHFQYIGVSSAILSVPALLITMPAAIIVSREIIVSALREWMAELGKRARVAVSSLGKIKTTVQMLAMIVLLYCDSTTSAFFVFLGYLLLYVAAVLTIWSMLIYLKAAWVELSTDPNGIRNCTK
ncbi:MAG: CDP-diacylglycerol--glycerol-3-phosphate 3-phosphatidyltransferase [Gammaproteobacteria bacterium RIFCSPHIGHO2_12_FULL_41_20]|nr:MAG: CDP-diacylglycerol--glycerol-3-phosphate 3-phosphatidyltransferase [Gammaproteobacteria bacterium RIFCSPHIGHO2_12_FULL_41_20]